MQARILFAVVFIGVMLSAFAFVPSVFLAVREKGWGMVVIDALVLTCGIALLLTRGMRYEVRAWAASGLVYAAAVHVLSNFGFMSGGPVWLFAFGVLCGLLLGLKPAMIGIGINIVTLLFFGWLHAATPIGQGPPFFATWARALAFAGSFVFLNALVAISCALLIQDEKKTSGSLKNEKYRILEAKSRLEAEVVSRREAEDRQRELAQELEFLYDTAMEFVGEREEAVLFQIIGRRILDIAGDVFVVVNAYEPKGREFRSMAVEGIGTNTERVLNALGQHPVGLVAKLNDEEAERRLKTGKLTDGPQDLHELTFGTVPRPIGHALEKLLSIRRIYAIGFVHKGDLFGSAIIIDRNTSPHTDVMAKQRLLEAYVNQAALALLRLRFERELKESEERYRQLVNNVPVGIYELDLKNFAMVSVNHAMCAITGYTEAEFMALNPASLFSENSLDHYIERGRAAFAGQPISASSEYKMIRKDGSAFWVRFQSRVHYTEGFPVKATIVVHNITDLKSLEHEKHQLQESLLEARKMEAIATLAGGVAHQFNNALSVVTGGLDMLDRCAEEAESRGKYLRMIRLSTNRMVGLTSQLLAYAGVGRYYDRVFSLSRFMAETLPFLLSTLPAGIQVETEFQEDTPTVKMDPYQMKFLLSTLLANASEAMDGTGRVRISCKRETIEEAGAKDSSDPVPGTYTCLTIQDSGKGMSPKTLRRVFDPFFTTKFQGRGLAMPAVLGIVKNHGGWIHISSEPGKGTTVRILFPACKEPSESTGAPAQIETPGINGVTPSVC